jgi:hypothetical protein
LSNISKVDKHRTRASTEFSMYKLNTSKKIVDRDVQLLSNRIALLKNEEHRVMKKIETAKKKANEIISMKQTNEIRQRIREELERQRHEEMMRGKDKIQEL